MAYFCLQIQHSLSTNSDVQDLKAFNGLDILINTCFLLDGLLRLLGLYIFVRIEQAFHREISLIELLRQSGILDMVVSCISFGYLQSVTGMWIKLLRLILVTVSVLEVFPYVDVLMVR
jgi:hypothetical protein